MYIDYNILITYGGVAKKAEKGEILFHEGTMPHFFYQIIQGEVKLYSTNTEGRELIQGVFKEGQSFGEPPLLLDKCYPSTAEVIAESVIVKISKEKLFNILKDFPELMSKLLFTFAERIYSKASSVRVWVGHTPEEKILQFLNNEKETKPVPYTRQQIADFTGLRVETVIRTLTRMDKEGKVKIKERKLYY